MPQNKLQTGRFNPNETPETLLDRAYKDIDRAILPDFFPRLKAADPGLSAELGEADRRVSRAYRSGDIVGLREELEVMMKLYHRGCEIVYSR